MDLARLYLTSYLGRDEQPTQGLCAYLEKLYFSDPWRDLEASPSIVYVDPEGDIRGFFGCFPRRFVCGDKPVSAVALSALMAILVPR